jgi:hypothetical protein
MSASTVVAIVAYMAIAIALWLALSLLRHRKQTGRRRSFWWQMNQTWTSATTWTTTITPYDSNEDELVRLLHGDRAQARRLIKVAGSADRAIAQLLRDRR